MSRNEKFFWILILGALGLLSMVAKADEYCDYTKERAAAEQILSQSPSAILVMGRNDTSQTNTLGLGVTESLSKFLRGRLSQQVGQDDCRVYQLTNEIQKHVSFDLSNIQLKQANVKLAATKDGITKINGLIEDEKKRLAVGASTLSSVESLEAALARLEDSQAQLEQQIALIHVVPTDKYESLQDLIELLATFTHMEQHDLAHQAKYDNWDVTVSVGEGSDPSRPMFSGLPHQTFAAVTGTYSFGGPSRNTHLDLAAEHLSRAMENQETGPAQLAASLRGQVTAAMTAAQRSEASYERYNATLSEHFKEIEGLDSAAARAFRVELSVEKIQSDIDMTVNSRSATIYRRYLEANFPHL